MPIPRKSKPKVTADDSEWQRAFALQALSDLDARELLIQDADQCHELHFLQMAAEKVCKAHTIALQGYGTFRERHDVIAKTLPLLARQFSDWDADRKLKRGHKASILRIAREIEALSPMCKEGGTRPDNTEYPWTDNSGHVQVPCLHNFTAFEGGSRALFQVIKLLRVAAKSYAS